MTTSNDFDPAGEPDRTTAAAPDQTGAPTPSQEHPDMAGHPAVPPPPAPGQPGLGWPGAAPGYQQAPPPAAAYGAPGAAAYGAPTELSPNDQRTMGMLAHVIPLAAMILSAGTLGFVASIVMYLLYKDRGAFVAQHARNSLNLQLTTLAAYVAGLIMLLTIVLIPVSIIVWLIAAVASTVIHIIAAIRAINGEWYQTPMTINFIKA